MRDKRKKKKTIWKNEITGELTYDEFEDVELEEDDTDKYIETEFRNIREHLEEFDE